MVRRGTYRTPDLYFEKQVTAQRARTLEEVDISTTAFFGFTRRGPLGEPTRVTSWKGFEALFGGFAEKYALPQSVFGFFANGGSEALIVRVAHREGEGAARQAEAVLRDAYDHPTLKVTAREPGDWGNRVTVQVRSASKPTRTSLTAALEPGATSAEVSLTRGFEPGAVLRVHEGARQEYVTLAAVERKRLVWDKPLNAGYALGEGAIEAVEAQLTVSSPFSFEIHDNLSFTAGHPRNLAQLVNERSTTVTVEQIPSKSPAPYDLPQAEVEVALRGGDEGVRRVRPADFIGFDQGLGIRSGLFALEEHEDVGLICFPDLWTAVERGDFNSDQDVEVVQQAALDYCERVKTAIAILDVPKAFDGDQALDWRARFDSKYGALYWPWLTVQDPLGHSSAVRDIPPCGHVCGLIARTDDETGVHRAPANLPLKDVLALEREVSRDVLDYLSPEGVNCIRAYRGRGIRPWGARTLSSNTSWRHINVRRLFLMLQRTIVEGTEWAVFERNDYDTWKAIERQLNTFLLGIWRQGMLTGKVPEEGFFVRCDEALNPPETRDAGEIHCEIGVAPVLPAEFIVFRIGQQAKDVITETEAM